MAELLVLSKLSVPARNVGHRTKIRGNLNGVRAVVLLSMCLVVSACGNKGPLFLNEIGLSEEEQQLLDELNEESVERQEQNETDVTGETDETEKEDEENDNDNETDNAQ